VIAVVALVACGSGVSLAAASLPSGSVGTSQLRKGAVTTAKLHGGAVTSPKVKDHSIGAVDLAAGAARSNLGSPGPWHALPLVAGWTNFGSGYAEASFRVDQLGRVQLRGTITKASGTPGNESIATLPAGYRPPASQLFPVVTGDPALPGVVSIFSNGDVQRKAGASGEQDYLDLGSITFWTD
jgi:hypothetical protein